MLNLNDGYSFVWLSLPYIVGAWLKKRAGTLFKSKWLYIGTVFLIVATWLIKIINHGNEYLKDIMISYCSPTIIWIAIFLTVAFARIRLGKIWKKIVAFLAPSAFSVYLIHVHLVIWNELMKDQFSWIGEKPAMVEVALVVCAAFCIFIACLLIDIVIRKPVFCLLKVNSHIEKMVGQIEKKYQ